ncbi:MAG TPA: CoB--CoM heterodisulfide reductase iron-sulfur subunit B family protein [bacterium]|nr:CoB--CoM heterodisulfide reductase iron-sulfur subunit B family protein [bacterium]HQL61582.1 CoB--CoM heterodisulfide reductase iron-sulfur subunit B family protein [bacterium]
MKYAFFPGCSLESTAWDFKKSTLSVCAALRLELHEIADWICCGSTPAHASNASLAVALPVFSLLRARDMGMPVMAACASCYSRLRTANYKITHDPAECSRAERITGMPYDGSVQVQHILDVLANDLGTEEIRRNVSHPLGGLKVACYYGCLLSRPPEIVAFDDPEYPTCMEEVLRVVGAEAIDWPYKTECCGASLSITDPDVVRRLGYRLLSMAHRAGAECIAVACPLCQSNLDLRQADIGKSFGEVPEIPILYITQLLGLALGLSVDELALEAPAVDAMPLLAKHGILNPAEGGKRS